MKERVMFRVTGRVQGVWFRAAARDAARELGVTGWVRNALDGSVEGEAFGEPNDLERFVAWLQQGSPHSRVDNVDLKHREESPAAPASFEVRH